MKRQLGGVSNQMQCVSECDFVMFFFRPSSQPVGSRATNEISTAKTSTSPSWITVVRTFSRGKTRKMSVPKDTIKVVAASPAENRDFISSDVPNTGIIKYTIEANHPKGVWYQDAPPEFPFKHIYCISTYEPPCMPLVNIH